MTNSKSDCNIESSLSNNVPFWLNQGHEKEKFCVNCGAKIKEGTKFCPECGTAINNVNNYSSILPIPPLNQQKEEARKASAAEKYATRQQEYAGKIIKCPSCGADIPSFTGICPECGHEINSSSVSESLALFVEQIDECDRRIANSPGIKSGWSSWSIFKKIGWIILNITFCFTPLAIYFFFSLVRINKEPLLTQEEKQKVMIIENYTFPNDRGTILEALLFVESKMAFLLSSKKSINNVYWMSLWAKKGERLYQKAEMLFPGDNIASDVYKRIVANNSKIRRLYEIRRGITIILICVLFLLIFRRSVELENERKTEEAEKIASYDVTYEWPQNQLSQMLSEPDIEHGKIMRENTEIFQIELYKVTQEQFDAYVNACRKKGFNDNLTRTDSTFYANNEEGYDLDIIYYENDQEMHISIDSYNLKGNEDDAKQGEQ